jgi:lipopolysaccharide transport system ATP-binding protein
MSDVAIRVEGLGKRYRIGEREPRRDLRDTLAHAFHAPYRALTHSLSHGGRKVVSGRDSAIERTIWALKDVSFDVRRGEAVGIIGRNGAGKSTLLKILSRITEPTEGYARINGRVGSLLEVGTGFHPELTGRENIYLNGAILGMKKTEIDCKFDEIVAFAEVEKFVDTPVKHYSSGMHLRLAFSVAAHLEPEILLIDEVLAVGDAAFQKKCLGKMEDVSKKGRTILFVSHNMAAIDSLCTDALLVESGSIILRGSPMVVTDHYLNDVVSGSIDLVPLRERTDRRGNGTVRLTSYHLEDTQGNALLAARSGMDVVFSFGYECPQEPVSGVDIGFSIAGPHGQMLFVLYSSYVGQTFSLQKEGSLRCSIDKLPLSPGRYRIDARVTVGGDEADWPQTGIGFLQVEEGDFYGTGKSGFGSSVPFRVDGNWTLR